MLNRLDAPEERLWYPNADVEVSVAIQATFPNGARDQTKRAVSENAKTLASKTRIGSENLKPTHADSN